MHIRPCNTLIINTLLHSSSREWGLSPSYRQRARCKENTLQIGGSHPIATWMILSRKAAKDAKATRNQRQEQSLRNLCALSGLARVIFATNAKPRRGLILSNPRLRERSDRSLGVECSERNPRPASKRLNSGTRRNIFAFAHFVLLCVFEALSVWLSASLFPGLRSLSLA